MTWTGTDPVKWAQDAIKKAEAAPRVFADEMANSMAWTVKSGGFTPLDTGNLSRSVTISMTKLNHDPDGYHSPIRQDYVTASKAIKGDVPFFIQYKAAYAKPLNYGYVGDYNGQSYNQAGRAFLEANIARAPQLMQKVATRLQNEN